MTFFLLFGGFETVSSAPLPESWVRQHPCKKNCGLRPFSGKDAEAPGMDNSSPARVGLLKSIIYEDKP
ncbi:hypothetical protein J7L05_04530 [bacterium]|nr:hypothetical protein [bacterium]